MTVSGAILDVAVDIRPWSSTFKKWISVVLSRENGTSLWIPQGFAHGFLALEDSDIIYLATKEYSPELDCGIRWDDSDIGVKWPIVSPIISSKDRKLKSPCCLALTKTTSLMSVLRNSGIVTSNVS